MAATTKAAAKRKRGAAAAGDDDAAAAEGGDLDALKARLKQLEQENRALKQRKKQKGGAKQAAAAATDGEAARKQAADDESDDPEAAASRRDQKRVKLELKKQERKQRMKERKAQAREQKQQLKAAGGAQSDKSSTGLEQLRELARAAAGAADMSAWLPLCLHPLLEGALALQGFASPTPVQQATVPLVVRDCRDVIGAAQTGSGKTLAFGLPILQLLLQEREAREAARAAAAAEARRLGGGSGSDGDEENGAAASGDDEDADAGSVGALRALILAPTRELALQVCAHLQALGKVAGVGVAPIVGGIAAVKQERLLGKKPEVVVATPGRLWDMMRWVGWGCLSVYLFVCLFCVWGQERGQNRGGACRLGICYEGTCCSQQQAQALNDLRSNPPSNRILPTYHAFNSQGHAHLNRLEHLTFLVIDEADRMVQQVCMHVCCEHVCGCEGLRLCTVLVCERKSQQLLLPDLHPGFISILAMHSQSTQQKKPKPNFQPTHPPTHQPTHSPTHPPTHPPHPHHTRATTKSSPRSWTASPTPPRRGLSLRWTAGQTPPPSMTTAMWWTGGMVMMTRRRQRQRSQEREMKRQTVQRRSRAARSSRQRPGRRCQAAAAARATAGRRCRRWCSPPRSRCQSRSASGCGAAAAAAAGRRRWRGSWGASCSGGSRRSWI